jgi:hypothetical protein
LVSTGIFAHLITGDRDCGVMLLLLLFSSRQQTRFGRVKDRSVAIHQYHGRGDVEDASSHNYYVAEMIVINQNYHADLGRFQNKWLCT